MRDQEESTLSSPNVFTPRFLERLAELPRSGSRTSFEANHAGPWTVVRSLKASPSRRPEARSSRPSSGTTRRRTCWPRSFPALAGPSVTG